MRPRITNRGHGFVRRGRLPPIRARPALCDLTNSPMDIFTLSSASWFFYRLHVRVSIRLTYADVCLYMLSCADRPVFPPPRPSEWSVFYRSMHLLQVAIAIKPKPGLEGRFHNLVTPADPRNSLARRGVQIPAPFAELSSPIKLIPALQIGRAHV